MIQKKNTKICNHWTFLPAIQLINHLFKKCYCTFYIYVALRQKAFGWILKIAELQARMSGSCRFLLFLDHKYQVSLKGLKLELTTHFSNFKGTSRGLIG